MTLTDCDYAKKQHKEWKTGAGAAVASLKRPRPGAVVPGGSSAVRRNHALTLQCWCFIVLLFVCVVWRA